MPFNSLAFFLAFSLVFGIYWAIPSGNNHWRKLFLVLVSYLLYMNWKPAFAIVLMFITVMTYVGACILERCNEGNTRTKLSRLSLAWMFVLIALLPLLVFKYYNFLNTSISDGLAAVGLRFILPGLNWAIPVGISFFSFQAVGYMLDVYHRRVKAEKDFVDYLLFVSFFPQIASGPISKADELLPQIKKEKSFDYSQVVSGLKCLLWGMFLKVVLADRAGIYVDTVFGAYQKYSGLGCAIASILYSIQIYADFAGYSLIAVGLAKTLGFDLINNFKRPYLAVSITDFWRRWHISLTRWLTQQIYIPMGGNRCSKVRNYWNILVTFLVSGIWHGANWTFILWGVMHGVAQIVEKALGLNKKESKGIMRAVRILVTFILVSLAWVFFRSPTLADAFAFIARFFSSSGRLIADSAGSQLLYCFIAFLPLFFYEIMKEYRPDIYSRLMGHTVVRWATYLAVICMILLVGVHDGSSFIYVSF